MRVLKSKKSKAVVATAALVLLGSGSAFAYFTSTGTGTGAGSTGTSSLFTVTGGAVTGAALTPGSPSQTLAFTVTNPGTGSQNLSSVVASIAGAAGTTWVAVTGCSAADYAVGIPAIAYGQIAPGGSVTGSVTVTMNNLSTSQDACKNVAYPLYFAAS